MLDNIISDTSKMKRHNQQLFGNPLQKTLRITEVEENSEHDSKQLQRIYSLKP